MVRRDQANDYVVLLDSASAADPTLPRLPDGADVAVVPVTVAPARAAAAAGSRGILDVLRMTAGLRRARADVAFFPASYSYFPVLGPSVVVTVHDAIAERLPHLTLAGRRDRLRWRIKQAMALRQADAVLTVSNASQEAIVETLGVRRERIRVIREAPDPAFQVLPAVQVRARLERLGVEPDSYFLYVGGISPHKNLGLLVDAFADVAAVNGRPRLLVVGDLHDDAFLSSASSLQQAVASSSAADRITFTGYVPDDELVALYCGAIATVLPSLGEGFGLTAAESAACGTPVVASRDPALVELLGDAGMYADSDDRRAFASQLGRLADDPGFRAHRSAAVLGRAAGWSWAAAADATIALLEEVARG
jgi:glycosyltransferase involved in cell wall biosynthesis